jgi:hypothetical protein
MIRKQQEIAEMQIKEFEQFLQNTDYLPSCILQDMKRSLFVGSVLTTNRDLACVHIGEFVQLLPKIHED